MAKHISKAKVLLSIVLVLCLVAVMLPTGIFTVFAAERATSTWGGAGDVATSFAGGTGKADNPYLISSAAQLALLAQNVNGGVSTYKNEHIKLTVDIDLAGKDWTPIGGGTTGKTFYGSFDGDGHTIKNLSVTGTGSASNISFGLFGLIANATIKNVHLVDASVTADDVDNNFNVGGLVGKMTGASALSGCSFNGTVTTSGTGSLNRYVGALVGWHSGSGAAQITNCFTTGTINLGAKARVAGLVGIVFDTNGTADLTVKNSYCVMNITGATATVSQAAGLVSNVSSTSLGVTIENCFFAGTIDSAYPFTYSTASIITVKSNVYIKEGWCTKTGTVTPNGIGVDTLADRTKTAEEFKNGTVTKLLDGDLGIWMTGREYPVHKRALPTLSTLKVNNQAIELVKGFTEYDAAQVEHSVETIAISATTALEGVTVKVNNANAEGVVTLGIPGTTTKITIEVDDGVVANAYTVNVYRKPTPWNGTDIEPFAGGTGTEEDPYLVANAAQLKFMAKTATDLNGVTIGDKHYPYNNYSNKVEATSFEGTKNIKIIADIDLNGKPWMAIASAAKNNGTYTKDSNGIHTFTEASGFKGNLNGDNHTIYNMNCTQGSGNFFGFFALVSGTVIENLHFQSAIVNNGSTSSAYMGGITAKTTGAATFRNCSFNGDVKRTVTSGGTAQFVGGLIGMVQMSTGRLTLENCWSTGTVSQYANNDIGGLIGNSFSTNIKIDIKSSWSSMKVENTRSGKLAGGLVGGLSDGAVLTITDSYFNGSVNRPYPICSDASGVTLQNVHYTSDYYAGTDTSAVAGGALTNATAQTDPAFADGTVTNLLNGDKTPIWATSTAGYPVLSDVLATANNALTPVGTSIRSKGTSQGIRFKFTIENTAKTAMLKEAGIVVAQLSDADGNIKPELEDENLTMHNLQPGDAGYYKYVAAKAYEKGTSTCAFVNYTDDKDWFAAALVNFKTPEKLTNKYIARSYAIYTDARGQEILVYSDVMGDKKYHVSVEDIANEYYNNEAKRAQLTADELTYVKGIVEGAGWYVSADWNEDGVLKILAIGNSFSDDSMNHVYNIAKAAGVQKIYLGNLYYAGCTLSQHLSFGKNNEAKYEYRVNSNGSWVTTKEYKMVDAVKDENWDFISFQQGSTYSGQADTYDKLDDLMDFVEPLCTNPKVKFAWHMTWAYQGDCTHNGFANYNNDQMTMYNDILSAVQNKIVTNDRIVKIIPNGTAIQNARTSYIGDNFTRDGYHLAKPLGRFIAGLGAVETLIGIDWDKFDLEFLSTVVDDLPEDETLYFEMALESVKNAVAKPFEITQSTFTETAE